MENVMNVGEAWLGSYSVTSLKEIAWSRDPVLEASRLKVPGGRGGGWGAIGYCLGGYVPPGLQIGTPF